MDAFYSQGLRASVNDPDFIESWQKMKLDAKNLAMDYIEEKTGVKVSRNSMLDMQVRPNFLKWLSQMELSIHEPLQVFN